MAPTLWKSLSQETRPAITLTRTTTIYMPLNSQFSLGVLQYEYQKHYFRYRSKLKQNFSEGILNIVF